MELWNSTPTPGKTQKAIPLIRENYFANKRLHRANPCVSRKLFLYYVFPNVSHPYKRNHNSVYRIASIIFPASVQFFVFHFQYEFSYSYSFSKFSRSAQRLIFETGSPENTKWSLENPIKVLTLNGLKATKDNEMRDVSGFNSVETSSTSGMISGHESKIS